MQRSLHLAIFLRGATLALTLASVATAGAAEKRAVAAASAPIAKPHPLLGVPVTESQFVNDISVGKDPFFPDSNRRQPKSPILSKAVVTEVNRANLLTLRGITGQAPRRFALINNLTFVAGEEGTVRTSAGLLKIRVQTVEDKVVTVLIDGESQARELVLDDAIPKSIQIQTSQLEK